jgi:DNA-binding XRE family transcriptional regulator
MSTNFQDYVHEVEEQSTPEELHALNAARARFALGASIHDHRKAMGLTQEQLAVLTGISQADISRIERGQCNLTIETLVLLGEPLGMRPEYVEAREPVAA